MSDFQPIESQEELDRIIQTRIARVQKALEAERQVSKQNLAHSRKWEERAKQNAADLETWKREARTWETRSKTNLAVIAAHEKTIQKFIDRLDDVLSEED
ncbi:hypothetical protein ACH0AH_07835 [Microbacterium paludicola]|uniref:hypothetical protein n=1 Tax=Microbacterium paludicola TaxID=300019 RepID=UPI003879BC09